jgi:hypothetical protein
MGFAGTTFIGDRVVALRRRRWRLLTGSLKPLARRSFVTHCCLRAIAGFATLPHDKTRENHANPEQL